MQTSLRLPFDGLKGYEAVLGVELDRARLRINDHPCAADLVGHPQCQSEHELEQLRADPRALGRPVDGESGEPSTGRGDRGSLF